MEFFGYVLGDVFILSQFSALFVASHAYLLGVDKCALPPPADNVTMGKFNGVWYEIGSVQSLTPGGFGIHPVETNCVCSTLDYQPDTLNREGDETGVHRCRKFKPTGGFQNVTYQLRMFNNTPGHCFWEMFGFMPIFPRVNYTTVYLDDQLALVYDCGRWGAVNYRVYLLSRTPTIADDDEQMLICVADKFHLNVHNAPYKKTQQENCWGNP